MAYAHEFSKWQMHIDAAASDRSLSRDQRAAAVAALRIRQQIEAKGAERRVIAEERGQDKALRAAHRAMKPQEKPRL